jgi:hypothetical protein
MNKLTTALASTTIGSIAISLMASSWEVPREPNESSLKPVVQYGGSSSTFGNSTAISRFSLLKAETASLVSFYSDLLASQEELGPTFERVLFEHAWDLYAR